MSRRILERTNGERYLPARVGMADVHAGSVIVVGRGVPVGVSRRRLQRKNNGQGYQRDLEKRLH
jgi:hypothetical protein